MRRNTLFAIALVGLCAAPAQAQDAVTLVEDCNAINTPGGPQIEVRNRNPSPAADPFVEEAIESIEDDVRFLCNTVATTLSNIQPAIGIGFSGGNPTLGMGGTLGTRFGFVPRFAVTARVNAVLTEVPDLQEMSAQLNATNPSLDSVPTTRMPLGAIQGDLAIGVFNGITLVPMLGGLGSIDLLGSVSFIPMIEDAGLEDAIVSWGVGARVGILKGGLVAPGLSVSGMYRRIGEASFGDIEAEDPDPGEFAMDLSTLSLRAALSKGIAMFDFAVGAGYDKYTSDPSFNFALNCRTAECTAAADPANSDEGITVRMEERIGGEVETAAWNVFGNFGMSLLLLNLVGEIGYQKATDVLDSDDVQVTEEELSGGRIFGSLGLRLTL